jgi:hypothetical protein
MSNRQQIPNWNTIRQKYPELVSAFLSIQQSTANISDQTATDAQSTNSGAPPQISGINVTEAAGVHDIQITDNTSGQRGRAYFADYSDSADFKNYHTISLGPSQNHRANLGAGVYHWRAYSSYGSSDHSEPLMHGGATATPVGSGAMAGPPMQAKQGSTGFGPKYQNTTKPPIRS